MKRTIATTAAGIIAASLLGSPAMAQVGVGAEAGAGVGVGATGAASGTAAAGVEAGTTGALSASKSATTDLGQVVSSIRSSTDAAADLAAVAGLTDVSVVSVDAIAKGQNEAALENALADNPEAAADVRSSIEANAELSAALEDQGVDLSSVVAATVNADGSVTVVTR